MSSVDVGGVTPVVGADGAQTTLMAELASISAPLKVKTVRQAGTGQEFGARDGEASFVLIFGTRVAL